MTPRPYPNRALLDLGAQYMQFHNIDQQAACLTDYDQKYQQISRGKYRGQFRTVLLDDEVGLYFETFNQTLDQWGATPPDRYGFIFFMDPTNFGHLGGNEFCGEDILFLPPGHSFDFRAPPQTSFCVVSIDHFAFELVLQGCFEAEKKMAKAYGETSVIRDQDCLKLLRQIAIFLVRRIEQQRSEGSAGGMLSGAKRSLCELLGGLVVNHHAASTPARTDVAQVNEALARRIRDFIRDRRGIGLVPSQLAQEFAISRRHLDQVFHTWLGNSPAEYIQIVKLNEFRSALLISENRDRTIGDIAADFEIWHLSRLAQIFRRHFGELPSDSRADRRNIAES